MTSKTISVAIAIFAAPIGYGLLFAIGLREGNHDFEVQNPIGLFVTGYFIGLIPVLSVGLPVFLFMLRNNYVRWWTVLMAGCCISMVFALLLGTSSSRINDVQIAIKYGAIVSAIFFGTYEFMLAKLHKKGK